MLDGAQLLADVIGIPCSATTLVRSPERFFKGAKKGGKLLEGLANAYNKCNWSHPRRSGRRGTAAAADSGILVIEDDA
jgi:hypothetical protein